MSTLACKTCFYWHKRPDGAEWEAEGFAECHAHGPQLPGTVGPTDPWRYRVGLWALSHQDALCGDWKPADVG